MVIMHAIIDTNILIDYLNGLDKAKDELARYKTPAISIITWMEILIGAFSKTEEDDLRNFLSKFHLYDVSTEIAENAVKVRKQYKIRLPDAIIWATALHSNTILVTRNTKDFSKNEPSIRIPYNV
jgi:predicted nucleic acid-binding protein